MPRQRDSWNGNAANGIVILFVIDLICWGAEQCSEETFAPRKKQFREGAEDSGGSTYDVKNCILAAGRHNSLELLRPLAPKRGDSDNRALIPEEVANFRALSGCMPRSATHRRPDISLEVSFPGGRLSENNDRASTSAVSFLGMKIRDVRAINKSLRTAKSQPYARLGRALVILRDAALLLWTNAGVNNLPNGGT